MTYAKDITELIGNTPLVRINSMQSSSNLLLGKCEFMNPTHSIKDRIAYNMIEKALQLGNINNDTTIIEPTSGNTGIGLAAVCASKGLNLVLTMPSSMSIERRQLLLAFGAKLVLTDPAQGMKGAIDRAKELADGIDNSFMPQQFNNLANPQIHRRTTAQEIISDTDGKIDIFVAAVGTGGSLTGIAEVLKDFNRDIYIVAVEPDESAVLSGNAPAPHAIQGIGAGFIPSILNQNIYDEIIRVKSEDAINTSKKLAAKDGLLVGVSSGANVFAASLVGARDENREKTIVTILCDTGERYLSAGLYE